MKHIKKFGTGFFLALGLSTAFSNAAQACHPEEIKMRQRVDVAIDAQSGAVLYASNENTPFYQASLTKRMTLLLTFEALRDGILKRDQVIALPMERFKNAYGEVEFFDPVPFEFSDITVWDAVLAMNTRSSNRAPYGLGAAIAGSEDNFVLMMNQKAAEMGLTGTHYVSANGFPTQDVIAHHRTTALDHAKIVQALYREFPDFMKELNISHATLSGETPTGEWKNFEIGTTNPFIPGQKKKYSLSNVEGGKTGYACAAGPAIDVEAQIDGRRVIVVTGGHPSAASRNDKAYALIAQPSTAFLNKLELVKDFGFDIEEAFNLKAQPVTPAANPDPGLSMASLYPQLTFSPFKKDDDCRVQPASNPFWPSGPGPGRYFELLSLNALPQRFTLSPQFTLRPTLL